MNPNLKQIKAQILECLEKTGSPQTWKQLLSNLDLIEILLRVASDGVDLKAIKRHQLEGFLRGNLKVQSSSRFGW